MGSLLTSLSSAGPIQISEFPEPLHAGTYKNTHTHAHTHCNRCVRRYQKSFDIMSYFSMNTSCSGYLLEAHKLGLSTLSICFHGKTRKNIYLDISLI